ncbi:uncharacterized protein TNCT_369511 [Trichonephila clavata]|uniref:Uncharacterized protein n=1 Tax=Trichonephila clavata TaxID=2740835 RepID=A0A8X6F489_TRICU|nr:uncharacterized protein TNCT_369511 [Trichonephila clavata]
MLLKDEKLEVEDRYVPALLYNLVDKKRQFEEMLPKKIVEKYSTLYERIVKASRKYVSIRKMECYYFTRKDSFIKSEALQKVTHLNIFLWHQVCSYEDFLFYMSHLSEYSKSRIFANSAFKLLQVYFLDWPLQSAFLKGEEILLPIFRDKEFLDMLNFIIYERIMLGRKDFGYIDLLKGFWSLSPLKIRESTKTDYIFVNLS